MNCHVINDLIPLYIDDCCSADSAAMVAEHLKTCPSCKAFYDSMNTPDAVMPTVSAPKVLRKLNDWKASVLQSVLLFVSFAVITLGVALEAATPDGSMNGCWALALVIPSTGWLLSLTNWYFVRLYKSRRHFAVGSLLSTLGVTIVAYLWAMWHYGLPVANGLFWGIGAALTVIGCVMSALLSDRYAAMLGKD